MDKKRPFALPLILAMAGVLISAGLSSAGTITLSVYTAGGTVLTTDLLTVTISDANGATLSVQKNLPSQVSISVYPSMPLIADQAVTIVIQDQASLRTITIGGINGNNSKLTQILNVILP